MFNHLLSLLLFAWLRKYQLLKVKPRDFRPLLQSWWFIAKKSFELCHLVCDEHSNILKNDEKKF